MKRMKKIMALMLAAIMMMAMSVTAFAAEGAAGTHTLTVNVKTGEGVPAQTLKDQTIYLYKLFDVTESGTTESKNYAYTVNAATGYKDVLVAALNNKAITASSTDEDIANAVRNIGNSDTKEVQDFANAFTTKALTTSPKLEATAKSEKLGDVTSYTFNDLAAGYYLSTGKIPVVYMQNSGEGNIINPVASLLNDKVYAIPMIFIIGWRGEPGIHDEPQHIYQGEITLKLLEDMGIEAFVIRKETTDKEVEIRTWI